MTTNYGEVTGLGLARSISITELRTGGDFEEAVHTVINGLNGPEEQKADIYARIVEAANDGRVSLERLTTICGQALRAAQDLARG